MTNQIVHKFQVDRNKYKNGISDINNPDGYSFEKTNENKKKDFQKIKEIFKQYASFFKSYPDIFVDMVTPPGSKFKLFFYQRFFLRVTFRYNYVFAVLNRGSAKSFISILALILKCIFFPRIKLFICSGGKEQSANIAKEKIEEIFELLPILEREVKYKTFQKDYVKLVFQNDSKLDIVAVQNSTRGGRRNAGLVEEAVLVDGDKLNTIIIPLMAVNRRAANGQVDYNGELHKQQLYITTAGDKSCFAYQKLRELIKRAVTKGTAFVFGADYRLPVLHDLLDPNFVEEMREDGTFNPYDFAREWGSEWTGAGRDAFFDLGSLERNRIIKKAEFKKDRKNKEKDIIIVSCDVARCEGKQNADTGIIVFRLKLHDNGTYTKNIINVITIPSEHFEYQSIYLKRLVFTYEAEMLIVDANGMGVGLVDYLVKENIDTESGEVLPPFSVTNDERYDKYKTNDSLPLLYNIKSGGAGGEISSDIHVKCLSQISSGKVKFLVDELTAKQIIQKDNKKGLEAEEELNLLLPHIRTSILKDQMMNLKSTQQGKNVSLKPTSRGINKDLFSATEYGLFYIITVLEEENRANMNRSDEDMYFFASAGF